MHFYWAAEDSHCYIHATENLVHYSESSLKLLQLYVKELKNIISKYFDNNQ